MKYRLVPQPDESWLILTGGESVEMAPGVIGHKKSTIIARVYRQEEAERITAFLNSEALRAIEEE